MSFIKQVGQRIRGWFKRQEAASATDKERAMDERESDSRKLRSRYRRVAERLTENSSLRDELNDEKAGELLAWGSDYLKKVVDQTAELSDETADTILQAEMERITGIMRQVSQLAGAANDDEQQLSEKVSVLSSRLAQLEATGVSLPQTINELLSLAKEGNPSEADQTSALINEEEE